MEESQTIRAQALTLKRLMPYNLSEEHQSAASRNTKRGILKATEENKLKVDFAKDLLTDRGVCSLSSNCFISHQSSVSSGHILFGTTWTHGKVPMHDFQNHSRREQLLHNKLWRK